MFGALRRRAQRRKLTGALSQADLPPFPAAALRVIELLRDPASSLADIGAAVEVDAALTVKLLRTVNSAAYGLRQKVDSAARAVAMLGRGRVEAVVWAVGASRSVPRAAAPGYDAQVFWRRASVRAALARAVASRASPALASLNFTAALLQDMAIPMLAHHGPDRYGEVLEARIDHGGQLAVLERDAFGWDHSDVGAWMAEAWGFPAELAAAIGSHHGAIGSDPPAAGPARLAARLRDAGGGLDALVDTAEASFGLAADEVVELYREAAGEADQLASALVGPSTRPCRS